MVVGAGAAVAHHRGIAGELDVAPHRQRAAQVAIRRSLHRVGEVRRRPVRVDVREAARQHGAASGGGADGARDVLLDAGIERVEAVPGDGALEGVEDHAEPRRLVAVVRRAQEGGAPVAGGALAVRGVAAGLGWLHRRGDRGRVELPAVVGHEFERARHPRLQRVVGRLEAEHEGRAAAVADAVEGHLLGVEQAAVARVQARLRERPHGAHGRRQIGEAHRRGGAKARHAPAAASRPR